MGARLLVRTKMVECKVPPRLKVLLHGHFLPQESLLGRFTWDRMFHDGRIPRGRIVRICTSCPTWSLTWMVKNWSFLHKPMSWGLKGMLLFFPPEMMMDDDVDWVFLVAFYSTSKRCFKVEGISSKDIDMDDWLILTRILLVTWTCLYNISITISVAITWVKLLVFAFVWPFFFQMIFPRKIQGGGRKCGSW